MSIGYVPLVFCWCSYRLASSRGSRIARLCVIRQHTLDVNHQCQPILLTWSISSHLTSNWKWTPLEIYVRTFVGNPWVKVYPTMYVMDLFGLYTVYNLDSEIKSINQSKYWCYKSGFCKIFIIVVYGNPLSQRNTRFYHRIHGNRSPSQFNWFKVEEALLAMSLFLEGKCISLVLCHAWESPSRL